MHVDAYTETLRRTLVEISSLGDDRTQDVARSLAAALDPALRLVALQMLTDTADELNGELDGVHVAVVMDGSTPHLLVNQATPLNQDAEAVGVPVQNTSQVSQEPMAQEGNEVRTTLRLPESLKQQIDVAARAQGRSVNAWLVEAARSALAGHESPSGSWSSAGTWTAGTGTAHGASEFDGAGNRSGRPTGPTGRQTSGVTLTGWFG
ncbi:CopG family transcriptional regulator [Actinomyces oris]|uniref:CopG family transcriptional regulator n=1 Tax=Actinomyces oris TaxID=544580 RepID=A0AAE4G2Z1_9ACTO|nr:CopG family transcriptional regulator [Actinomyces oris]MDT0248194.1 CopG family transcriptional regulator [Actinomyces oris]